MSLLSRAKCLFQPLLRLCDLSHSQLVNGYCGETDLVLWGGDGLDGPWSDPARQFLYGSFVHSISGTTSHLSSDSGSCHILSFSSDTSGLRATMLVEHNSEDLFTICIVQFVQGEEWWFSSTREESVNQPQHTLTLTIGKQGPAIRRSYLGATITVLAASL